MSDNIVTPIGRLSFPSLHQKAKPLEEGQEGKYEVQLLIPKDEDVSGLKKAIAAVLKEKWPDASKRPKGLKNPLKDGDGTGWEGYEGCWYIKALTKRKPVVKDNRNQVVDDVAEEAYGGRYGRLQVNFYAYDHKVNKGISCGLNGVQLLSHGERFGGGGGNVDFEIEEVEEPSDDDVFGGNDTAEKDDNEELFH